MEGDEVGCTARGSVGRRLDKRAPVAPARGRGSGCMARLVHGRGCGGEEAAAKAAKRAVRARR